MMPPKDRSQTQHAPLKDQAKTTESQPSLLARFNVIQDELMYVDALNKQANQEESLFFDSLKDESTDIEINELTKKLKGRRASYTPPEEFLQLIDTNEETLTEDTIAQLQGICNAQRLVYETRQSLLHTLKEKVEIVRNPNTESVQMTLDQVHEVLQTLMEQLDQLEAHHFKQNLNLNLLSNDTNDSLTNLLNQVKLTIEFLQKSHFQLNKNETKKLIGELNNRILSDKVPTQPSTLSFTNLLADIWPQGSFPVHTESFFSLFRDKGNREILNKRLKEGRNFVAQLHPEENQTLLSRVSFDVAYQQYLSKQKDLLSRFNALQTKLASIEQLTPPSPFILGMREKLGSFLNDLHLYENKITSKILTMRALSKLQDEQDYFETILSDNELLIDSITNKITKQAYEAAEIQEAKNNLLFKATTNCLTEVKDEYLRILNKYGNTGQVIILEKKLGLPLDETIQAQMNQVDPRLGELARIYQVYQQCNLKYLTDLTRAPTQEASLAIREQYRHSIESQTQTLQKSLDKFPDRVDTLWGAFKRAISSLLSMIGIEINPSSTRTINRISETYSTMHPSPLAAPLTPAPLEVEVKPSSTPEEAYALLKNNYEALLSTYDSLKKEFDRIERLNPDSSLFNGSKNHLDAMHIELSMLKKKLSSFSENNVTQENIDKLSSELAILELRQEEIKKSLSEVKAEYHEAVNKIELHIQSLITAQKQMNREVNLPVSEESNPLRGATKIVSACKRLLKDHLNHVQKNESTFNMAQRTSEIHTFDDALLLNLERRLAKPASEEMETEINLLLDHFITAKQSFLDFHEALMANPNLSAEYILKTGKYHVAMLLKEVTPKTHSNIPEIKELNALIIMIGLQIVTIIERDIKKYAKTLIDKENKEKKFTEAEKNIEKTSLFLSTLQQQHLVSSKPLDEIQVEAEQIISTLEPFILPMLVENHQMVVDRIHAQIKNLEWSSLGVLPMNENQEITELKQAIETFSHLMNEIKAKADQEPSVNARDAEPFQSWQREIQAMLDKAESKAKDIADKELIVEQQLRENDEEEYKDENKNPRL
jgi:hypothetical protein